MKFLKGILFLLALQIAFVSLKANSISIQAKPNKVLHSTDSQSLPLSFANLTTSALEFEEDETDTYLLSLPTLTTESFFAKLNALVSPVIVPESNLQFQKVPLFLFIKKLSI